MRLVFGIDIPPSGIGPPFFAHFIWRFFFFFLPCVQHAPSPIFAFAVRPLSWTRFPPPRACLPPIPSSCAHLPQYSHSALPRAPPPVYAATYPPPPLLRAPQSTPDFALSLTRHRRTPSPLLPFSANTTRRSSQQPPHVAPICARRVTPRTQAHPNRLSPVSLTHHPVSLDSAPNCSVCSHQHSIRSWVLHYSIPGALPSCLVMCYLVCLVSCRFALVVCSTPPRQSPPSSSTLVSLAHSSTPSSSTR
jgi:hypothetical protein